MSADREIARSDACKAHGRRHRSMLVVTSQLLGGSYWVARPTWAGVARRLYQLGREMLPLRLA